MLVNWLAKLLAAAGNPGAAAWAPSAAERASANDWGYSLEVPSCGEPAPAAALRPTATSARRPAADPASALGVVTYCGLVPLSLLPIISPSNKSSANTA
jgi:hypothetical protein